MSQKKTAIITGSSSGIGSGIAKALAQAGCNIAINGSRDPDRIEDFRSVLEYGLWHQRPV